jgi:hypothetical protein
MRVLVVGGHTRNIGKTTLVVDLLRVFPDVVWTAVKITQYGHGVCSLNGEECGCAPNEHTFALEEERDQSGRTDTSRFLAAGAAHALWLRSKQGRLGEALPSLRESLDRTAGPDGHVIIESNTLLQFLAPALYLVVLDPAREDFKESVRRHLDRADGFVLRRPLPAPPAGGVLASQQGWAGKVPLRLLEEKPRFLQALGEPLPGDLIRWVGEVFLRTQDWNTRQRLHFPG